MSNNSSLPNPTQVEILGARIIREAQVLLSTNFKNGQLDGEIPLSTLLELIHQVTEKIQNCGVDIIYLGVKVTLFIRAENLEAIKQSLQSAIIM